MKEEEKNDLWRTRYEAFVRLYRGRSDIIAQQKEDGHYLPIEGEGFTFERFIDHVHLKQTYAIYNLDDLKRVHFGLFDIDVFPRNQEWPRLLSGIEEKRKETFRIMKTLLDMGLKREHLLLEFPTVGFHLLIFFKDPVEAIRLQGIMQTVLDQCHLSHIPLYPKKVEESRWGDRVQLPLRINRNTSRRSNFIRDLKSFDPEHYDPNPDFSVLDGIDPIGREWVDQWTRKK